ncbi:cuticle collagen 3A3-like [Canis lupus familiaris]|uniref:cuticle collagen 3A3-like n=1 Tax=Canis lupus familiaris TaxID=9615 RepID=UPI0018F7B977|nr:cuticle collagen 3A3-like [Canis lupus familiaris]
MNLVPRVYSVGLTVRGVLGSWPCPRGLPCRPAQPPPSSAHLQAARAGRSGLPGPGSPHCPVAHSVLPPCLHLPASPDIRPRQPLRPQAGPLQQDSAHEARPRTVPRAGPATRHASGRRAPAAALPRLKSTRAACSGDRRPREVGALTSQPGPGPRGEPDKAVLTGPHKCVHVRVCTSRVAVPRPRSPSPAGTEAQGGLADGLELNPSA